MESVSAYIQKCKEDGTNLYHAIIIAKHAHAQRAQASMTSVTPDECGRVSKVITDYKPTPSP